MNLYIDFGSLLQQARHSLKLSQAAVASEAGVTSEFYGRLERGHALPSLLTFVTLWQLLRFDGNAVIDALGVHSREIPAELLEVRPIDRLRVVHGQYVHFGQLFRQSRLERRLTQEAVAFAADYTYLFFGRIECGLNLPSIRKFATLRHCLGFDVNAALTALTTTPPREPYFAFGQILGAGRVKSRIESSELAQMIGCEASVYERFERGVELPTLAVLARLHHALLVAFFEPFTIDCVLQF